MSKKEEGKKHTALRDRVLKNISAEGFEEEEREIPVVARMRKRTVEILDSLVTIGVFKSRSEAAAALVEGAITSKEELFEDIRKQAVDLEERKESAMKQAQETILGKLK